ncbi:uncharacterized protein LOC124354065 [Homalodisca vitripennis]|uniref:uncharacterized protein LOC124354065 n=1 Tax=Homalodisca vitripennis TaxID=197043 RepID=UPI001EEB3373|nr:uncharacterized protein LOC124354065 [Homalodisca vitripennis]XP_046660200.1 uncharacterized protein LOC124354065 [Homalodisca vitripennis]KAG8273400.1 hypothetical protein J6590_021360 [Homalodisca vitripennis]
MVSAFVLFLILSECRLITSATTLMKAINEINQEIFALRTEANHETYAQNHKPHDLCPKKIMAFVPQKFGIKDTRFFRNFEKIKELLANITREKSIIETLDREIYIIDQFHNRIKFTVEVMNEDVETLSKRRLTGLANMCYQYEKIRSKSDTLVEGEDEVIQLRDKMEEAEMSLLYERMHDVKEDRVRMQKFCADRLKNITSLINEIFDSENKNDIAMKTGEVIRELEFELLAAHSMRESKKTELFNTPEEFEKLKKDLEMKAYVLDHYKDDIECYKKLKSSTMKIEKPSFGHVLYLLM